MKSFKILFSSFPMCIHIEEDFKAGKMMLVWTLLLLILKFGVSIYKM